MNRRIGNENFECARICGLERFTLHKHALLVF
jgi:hypothetical protein